MKDYFYIFNFYNYHFIETKKIGWKYKLIRKDHQSFIIVIRIFITLDIGWKVRKNQKIKRKIVVVTWKKKLRYLLNIDFI